MYLRSTSYPLSPLRFFVVCALLLLGAVEEGYGQRVYANSVSFGGSGTTNVGNAASPDGVTEPSATPRAKIALTNIQTGYIQLQFNTSIPQYSTVFLRVANETIEGALGGTITVSAYNNNTAVTSINPVKITTPDGWQLYAVNATGGNFNQVRITAASNLLSSVSVEVLYAFYEPQITECAIVLGTTTSISGLAVATIATPENAIDNNQSTYSTFSVALGILTTLKQTAYFSNLSNVGDAATVTFSVPSTILSLGLLSNVAVSAYRGNSLVSTRNLDALLTLDLLGLLNTGEKYTVSYQPTGQFDRIEISMTNAVGALGNLRVHEIQRTPAKPTVPTAYPDVIEICDGETAALSAGSSSSGSVLRWYNTVNDGTLLQESTGNTDTYTTPPLPYISPSDTTFLYVSASWGSGCPAESERAKIAVVVRPKPVVGPIAGQNDLCVDASINLTSATAGGIWSSSNNTVASVDPTSGIVSGNEAGIVTIRYTISDNQTFCANYQEKTITIHPHPGKPNLNINSND